MLPATTPAAAVGRGASDPSSPPPKARTTATFSRISAGCGAAPDRATVGRMAEDVFGIVGSLQAAVFRVERVVAEGGFGVVYRAHHEGFKAAVALKCLKIPGAFSAEQ